LRGVDWALAQAFDDLFYLGDLAMKYGIRDQPSHFGPLAIAAY
jgi:hypothetical protein